MSSPVTGSIWRLPGSEGLLVGLVALYGARYATGTYGGVEAATGQPLPAEPGLGLGQVPFAPSNALTREYDNESPSGSVAELSNWRYEPAQMNSGGRCENLGLLLPGKRSLPIWPI